jgi:protein-S-isoprenylcysteine O-methyltransferase Ste14
VIFRFFVRRDYAQRGSLTAFSTFLEFLIFGMHANLPYLYLQNPWPGFPPLPENSLQVILGFGFISLGLVAILGIMAYLGFSTTMGDHPDQLRQSGPYRWSRNPQLVTYTFILLGCVILYPTWQSAAWVVLFAAIAHVMVLTEEEHLARIFKDEYQRYRTQTPRYIRFSANVVPKD